MTSENDSRRDSILVIRLGAMGDIVHALPAVASLKKNFPQHRLVWLVAPKWIPLIQGNPGVDELISFDRNGIRELQKVWSRLRNLRPRIGIDFQGLVQSAIAGRASRPDVLFGFDHPVVRERIAALFYTHPLATTAVHRVERNLQLAEFAGASGVIRDFWLPPGQDEGELPSTPFVLTNPFAGWAGKQWPIENYDGLAQRLCAEGVELVANVSPNHADQLRSLKHVWRHTSSIEGLIAATRRATAVLGVDSGPLHLAAALQKPGVALFGPTDPAQTGPYGGSMTVIRSGGCETTYKRHGRIHSSMREITVDQVFDALMRSTAANQLVNVARL